MNKRNGYKTYSTPRDPTPLIYSVSFSSSLSMLPSLSAFSISGMRALAFSMAYSKRNRIHLERIQYIQNHDSNIDTHCDNSPSSPKVTYFLGELALASHHGLVGCLQLLEGVVVHLDVVSNHCLL